MTPAQEQWNARVDAARREHDANRLFIRRPPAEPKPGSRHPFKHADTLYNEIVETRARLQGNPLNLQEALSAFPPYISRGHGGKHRTRNRTIAGILRRHESKLYPNPGQSEAARRVFQALSPWERKLAREVEVGL